MGKGGGEWGFGDGDLWLDEEWGGGIVKWGWNGDVRMW